MLNEYIKIDERDNVIVALRDLSKGTVVTVGEESVTLLSDVKKAHKIALRDVMAGDEVIKYGNRIGHAKENIPAGSHVHVHNLATALGEKVEYRYEPDITVLEGEGNPTFWGYRRSDGSVGIRNDIAIVTTVGCIETAAKAIERRAQSLIRGNIDSVFAITHPYGCSQMGADQETTLRLLASVIKNPNFAGVLVLGLGCENCNVAELKKRMVSWDEERVKFLIAQEVSDEVESGLELVAELIDVAEGDVREECPLSELTVGVKCGGSDGMSGITANPLIGRFTDYLTAHGGSVIMTEVPEMFGAETLLMNRARDEGVFAKTVKLINDFKDYYLKRNLVVYENPSPGNKAGGITTLEEKSLGCVIKAGRATVNDVIGYAERKKESGLTLLEGPGNDIVAVTALSAAGANLILFSTGRGTPLGACVPVVKVATNGELADAKKGWIDFDASRGSDKEFFDGIIATASGKKTKSEINYCREFAIFKDGVTL